MSIRRKADTTATVVGAVLKYSGNLAAALAGPLLASGMDPVGATAIAAFVGGALDRVGGDVLARALSERERYRVQLTLDHVAQAILRRRSTGERPRTDGFGSIPTDGRSSAEELFEGVLLTARNEYEERKLKYVANFYASLALTNDVGPPEANQMLRDVERLSYRQICILGFCMLMIQDGTIPQSMNASFSQTKGFSRISLDAEIHELSSMELMTSSVWLNERAQRLCRFLLATETIPPEDLYAIAEHIGTSMQPDDPRLCATLERRTEP